MSSTQRFLRQRVVGTTTLSVPTNPNDNLYVLVAGDGNYIGNYPPGYMVTASQAGALLPATVVDQFGNPAVLRDMGKTIKARVASAAPAISGTTFGTPGFFRAVQFVSPVTVATNTSATTFGVGVSGQGSSNGVAQSYTAGNPADFGYGTFYIPIVNEGIVAGDATGTGPITVPATQLNLGYLM
jgi:hypothetical protein